MSTPIFCGNPNCVLKSNLICSRCEFESYCSKGCQDIAFSSHRNVCFKIPPLRKIDEVTDTTEVDNEIELQVKLIDHYHAIPQPSKDIQEDAEPDMPPLRTINLALDSSSALDKADQMQVDLIDRYHAMEKRPEKIQEEEKPNENVNISSAVGGRVVPPFTHLEPLKLPCVAQKTGEEKPEVKATMGETEPYQGMCLGFVEGLRLLSIDEARDIDQNGLSGPFIGAQGLGFVRIEGASNNYWAAVDCSSFEELICPRHGPDFQQGMSIEKTVKMSSHNLLKAAFYKCNYLLPGCLETRCNFNIYPVLRRADLEQQWTTSMEAGHGPVWVLIKEN